jgi:hypothetical protein
MQPPTPMMKSPFLSLFATLIASLYPSTVMFLAKSFNFEFILLTILTKNNDAPNWVGTK